VTRLARLRGTGEVFFGIVALSAAACTSDYQTFTTLPGATDASASSTSSASSGQGVGGAGGGGRGPGSGGAATGGAGGAAPPCQPGDTYTLTDDFEDGSTDPTWVPYQTGIGAACMEAGGRLQLTSGYSLGGYLNYAGYRAAAPYDLVGCAFLVHAVTLPLDDVQAFLAFGINDFGDAVAIGADQGTISFCVTTLMVSDCTNEAHLGAGDDWWRIQETGGTLHLQTSADGAIWVTRRELPTPVYATAGDVEIGIGSRDPVDGSYDAALDDFNLPPR
jgi:hypothetical protein